MLAFIVIACHLNVSAATVPDKNTTGCKEVVEDLTYSTATAGDVDAPQAVPLNPMTCMANSRVMISKFAESNPGWQPRKWTCKYVAASQDI